jgi:hypothetical protein
MLSLEIYKVVHMTGLAMIMLGLGSLLGTYATGKAPEQGWRVSMAIVHGIGMAFVLIGGFGMMARLGLTGALPGWVLVKLTVWLILGGSMVLAKRKAHLRTKLLIVWALLVMLAAYMGIFKPI